MACDRVLVMSDGRVAEIGRPLDLLQQKGSLFADMARGDASAAALLQAGDGQVQPAPQQSQPLPATPLDKAKGREPAPVVSTPSSSLRSVSIV